MRPASEIHSALDIIEREFDRCPLDDGLTLSNLSIARDVLAWVAGSEVDLDGPNAWLVAFLLDDPPQLNSTPPEVN